MRNLSLKLQIFFLLAIVVLAVAGGSFRSTFQFLTQDKVSSLRELQTLSLMTTLQDLQSETKSLREELRQLASELYTQSDQVGTAFSNVASQRGTHVWRRIVLRQDHSGQHGGPRSPGIRAPTSSQDHVSKNISRSLLLDTAHTRWGSILHNHSGSVSASRMPASHNSASAQAATLNNQKTWTLDLEVSPNGSAYLSVTDPIKLGKNKASYILEAQVDISALQQVWEKVRFDSITSSIFYSPNGSSGLETLGQESYIQRSYKEAVAREIASAEGSAVQGKSITVHNGDQRSFLSFARLNPAQGKSNIILNFGAEEAALLGEFQAFMAEQVFIIMVILLGALLAGYFLAQLITDPVAQLVRATKRLEQGDFNQRVAVNGKNEIGELALAFNQMGQSLQEREMALEGAKSNLRQLSFQKNVFKKLTSFSEKLAAMKEPGDIKDAITLEWTSLLDVSDDDNLFALYSFDTVSQTYKKDRSNVIGSQAPEELSLDLWPATEEFSPTNAVIDHEAFAQAFNHFSQDGRLFRMPLHSDDGVLGVIVFTAHEVQTTEYFDSLIMEYQRILSSGLASADRYAKLREVSIRDGLTGLFNVRFLKECLDQEIKKAQQEHKNLSLLFFDVDHFKNYNDTNGHPAGDRVLKQMGQLLRSTFEPKDILSRYGGEEFVVLLKDCDHDKAMEWAEKFRHAVESSEFEHQEKQPLGNLTVSIGVSTFPEHAAEPAALIKVADDALYQAKKTSRNVVVSANATQSTSAA